MGISVWLSLKKEKFYILLFSFDFAGELGNSGEDYSFIYEFYI